MDLNQFLTVAGEATVIVILLEVIKRAAAWPAPTVERFAPLLAVVLGVPGAMIGSVVIGPVTPQGVFGAALTGILAGASASGLYDLGGKSAIRAVAP